MTKSGFCSSGDFGKMHWYFSKSKILVQEISVIWSVICCQDGCSTAFAKGALPEEYLSHNFDEQCLGGH